MVEPNVSMDRLVEATLEHSLIPPVVMDFPGITVGGGYAGTSGESSSFKYGFFDRTLNSVEMVLANGEVLNAFDTENADLFHGAAGAVGTMGVTTLAELKLVKAKKYVRTTYHLARSVDEAIRVIEKSTNDPMLDFVDGIVFSKDQAAVITGYMTDESTSRIQCFSDPWDPWFYIHVQDAISKRHSPVTETIPLAEYLFRYDRGGFWVGKSAFEYFHFPFNKYTRWWLDDFLHTRMLYTALHASPYARPYFVQDLALPFSTASSFINHVDETLSIYPLWLCPLRQSPLPTMHPHHASSHPSPLLNIGVWGWGPRDPRAFVAANRELEKKVRDLGGMKWLYAQTYYGEEDFWGMFDREWYEDLREKYQAKGLPSVWDKVHVDEESEVRAREGWWAWVKGLWPVPGVYGIWKAIRSGSYVEARRARWRGK
ncbi:FAD binding domain-containing protein [Viridothelium virens]|uniref:Delta(24)-sterol reductase n=1 Tax=Viridothelium virens TaxID=1048519 RepID=A0A6A6GZ75_VIRVR|nr:FAD binding domain-containing protein [Viridothelium virens]